MSSASMMHWLGRTDKLVKLALIIQLGLLAPLWGHISDAPQFLGRYSERYMIALIAHLSLIGAWSLAYYYRHQLAIWLRHGLWRWLWVVCGVAISGLWLAGIETHIKAVAAINWCLVGAVLFSLLSDNPIRNRSWIAIIIVLCALWLIPIAITALTTKDFSPDEAHWADYATSPYIVGGLYARTWLNEPVVITPGIGWSVAAYGWLLEHAAFDIRVGRLWNMGAYLLSFVGIGALAWRLYGGAAAWIAIALSFFSGAFFPFADYRPDQQLPFAAGWILFTAAQARLGLRHHGLWHTLCGLFCALSLQLHAAGAYIAVGVGLFYLVEALRYRQRALFPFGLGAALGALVYYSFNIAPVGGLSPFLNTLISERFGGTRDAYLGRLAWPSLMELVLGLLGWGYLLARRRKTDRLFLGLAACIIITFLLLDNWGYRTVYQALFLVPLAAFLSANQETNIAPISRRGLWLFGAIVWMLAAQMSGEFIAWARVGDVLFGRDWPPFTNLIIGERVKPHITDDDIIVSTHELIWTFQERPNFYSMAGEATAARRWGYQSDPSQVWARVSPTIVIHLEGRIALTSGLIAHMQSNNFVICERMNIRGIVVTIYRAQCPS